MNINNEHPIRGLLFGGALWGVILFGLLLLAHMLINAGLHGVVAYYLIGMGLHWEIVAQYRKGYHDSTHERGVRDDIY